MGLPTTVVAVAASQAARRGVAAAGAGFIASRAAGLTAGRFARRQEARIEAAAERAAGQEITAGDVPGLGGLL